MWVRSASRALRRVAYNAAMDIRYGGLLAGTIPTRHGRDGAFDTANTQYSALSVSLLALVALLLACLGIVGLVAYAVSQRAQLATYQPGDIATATYAITLEAEGGSPTGKPTGPVLFAGKLVPKAP